MKKPVIVLWIVAALFLICSFTFLPDGIAEFFCGVAIAAVLAFVGYVKNKKPKEAAVEAAFPQNKNSNNSPADTSPYDFIHTKIAGVTFKDGRKSRQTIIRRLYWKDEPFDKNAAEVILVREEFEGKPAFAVMLNGEKAGYVPAEYAEYVSVNSDRCDGVTHIEAYRGKDDIYGAKITIRFRKS